ncbi:hypothetical protein [Tumebacillus sp. BK434]|uniref:hypothetical protein n=1 Tax=Tumebacillus sp. BK434 TaxID=2512169 RepID=UPI0010462367|nr:hypothetical protein [Tumebacillus sp. BK434]
MIAFILAFTSSAFLYIIAQKNPLERTPERTYNLAFIRIDWEYHCVTRERAIHEEAATGIHPSIYSRPYRRSRFAPRAETASIKKHIGPPLDVLSLSTY